MLISLNEPTPAAGLRLAVDAVGRLLELLASDPLEQSAAELTKRWYGKRARTLEPHVEKLMELDMEARSALRDAFATDRNFSDSLDGVEPYRFAFECLDEALRTAASDLFVAMYDLFRGRGFPIEHDAVLNPNSFEQSFFEANEGLAVCPACMRFPLPRSLGGAKPYDIEHFFPKSAYPVLAVHHHNLVPTCLVCNQRRHGAGDPLDDGGRQPISTTYVPYRRAAEGELRVDFGSGNAERELRVELHGDCAEAERRIQTHDRMYGVSDSWTERLRGAYDATLHFVAAFSPSEEPADVVATLARLAGFVRRQMREVTDGALNAAYADYLAGAGLRGFLDDLRKVRELGSWSA